MIGNLRLLMPDFLEQFELRYSLLKMISINGPIGRRTLGSELKVVESKIRSELNFLLGMGYISVASKGVSILPKGDMVLNELKDYSIEIKRMDKLAETLEEILSISHCVVSETPFKTELGKAEVGRIASEELLKNIEADTILGVTGGDTMKLLSDNLKPKEKYCDISVVSARGTLDNNLENQSDLIAYQIAKKLGASYKGINLPDSLDEGFLNTLRNDPEIRNALDEIAKIKVLTIGVGRADVMGKKRSLRELEYKYLIEKRAVVEAFGNYFNIDGDLVFKSDSLLSIEDFHKIPKVIEVAAGPEKADAIIAFSKVRGDITLVTDRSCAEEIIKKVTSHESDIKNRRN